MSQRLMGGIYIPNYAVLDQSFVSGTWYDLLSISGAGVLGDFGFYVANTNQSQLHWRLTIDSLTPLEVDNGATAYYILGDGTHGGFSINLSQFHFSSSVLLEVKHDGSTNTGSAGILYGLLSA